MASKLLPWLVLTALAALAGCTSAHTRVVTFLPTAIPARAEAVSGSCWTHSIAAPARPDAWRCMLGNRIEDPCFEIAGHTELLCGANPAVPAAQAHPLALTLTLPLPHEAIPLGIIGQPWLIALADGSRCRPFTGTRPLGPGGRAGTYACSNGDVIYGSLRHGARWTALAGGNHASSTQSVAIRAAWQ